MPLAGGELEEKINNIIHTWGGDIWGVADITRAKEYIEATYGTGFRGLDRAISVGVYFPAEVVDELKGGPTHTYLYYYKVINTRLDDLALHLTNFLHKEGYRAFPIPASQRVTKDKLAGIFSHRLAAHLAGLGWIGKNGNLINPVVGPRLRLVTVLTDAPLESDEPIEEKCRDCSACATACPAGAIKGKRFNPGEPMEERLEPAKCDRYLASVRTDFGKRVCGLCLAVCPWGKSKREV